jgi:hypothetical protein
MNRLTPSLAVLVALSVACGGATRREDFSFLPAQPPATGDAILPHLVHAPDGKPWIAYADSKMEGPRVARWTGSTWEELGTPTPSNTGATVLGGQLAFDASGQPFLAERLLFSNAVRVLAWNAPGWTELGRFPSPHPVAYRDVSLRINPSGQPVVSSTDSDNVHVHVWNGSDFTPLGSGLRANVPQRFEGLPPILHDATLELDAQGTPVVAHLDGIYESTRLWVQRWTGSAWEPIGGGPVPMKSGFSEVSGLALALDADGRPYVAWSTSEISRVPAGAVHVRRWNGAAWEPVGSRLSLSRAVTPADSPTLRLDPQGRPVVSFAQGDSATDWRIQLWRFDGEAWGALGAPLFGAEPDFLHQHTTSIAPDGKPVVAWSQRVGKTMFTPGITQLYVASHVESR